MLFDHPRSMDNQALQLTIASSVVRATAFGLFLFPALCMSPVSSLVAESSAPGSDPDVSLLRSKRPTVLSFNPIPVEEMV